MLEGDLGDFSLPEILQLLAFTSKSGRLRMHGPSTAGCMVLADGQLMDVSADVARVGVVRRLLGRGHVNAQPIEELLREADELPCDRRLLTQLVERDVIEADTAAEVARAHMLDQLAELLRWTQGSFRFDVDTAAADGLDLDLGQSTEELVAAATQRLAGWEELDGRIGAGEQVVALNAPVPPHEVTVPADGWSLLAFVDGRRTVDDLVELTGRGPVDTRRILVQLLDHDIVSLAAPGEAAQHVHADALDRIAALEDEHHPGAAVEAAAAFGTGSEADAVDLPPPPGDAAYRPGDDHHVEVADSDLAHAATPSAPDDGAHTPGRADAPTDGPGPTRDHQEASSELAALDANAPDRDDDPGRPGRPAPPLVATVRPERLQTDPNIDLELVGRLIDGVKEL